MTLDRSLPSDLGNFGYIQIDHAIDLLKAIKEGYPRDFNSIDNNTRIEFNSHSGYFPLLVF